MKLRVLAIADILSCAAVNMNCLRMWTHLTSRMILRKTGSRFKNWVLELKRLSRIHMKKTSFMELGWVCARIRYLGSRCELEGVSNERRVCVISCARIVLARPLLAQGCRLPACEARRVQPSNVPRPFRPRLVGLPEAGSHLHQPCPQRLGAAGGNLTMLVKTANDLSTITRCA